jgi:hypothetical protein
LSTLVAVHRCFRKRSLSANLLWQTAVYTSLQSWKADAVVGNHWTQGSAPCANLQHETAATNADLAILDAPIRDSPGANDAYEARSTTFQAAVEG